MKWYRYSPLQQPNINPVIEGSGGDKPGLLTFLLDKVTIY